MLFPSLLSMATVALAAAETMTLSEVLNANNKTLSTLNSLLASQPALSAALASASPITILAPSNDAFSKLLSTSAGMAVSKDPSMVAALLEYHVLNGTFNSSAFTTTAQFVPSLLTNQTFTNVTGGQVVMGMLSGKTVKLMSGLKETSTVTTADVMFTGGVIHIIDTVLTIPLSPANSAVDSELTALAGALTTTSLVSAVDNLKDVTIFAPSNAAFQAIGSATSSLSTTQLSSILEYHIINGTVGYSTLLMTGLANETFPSLMGTELMVEATDKKVFVNSAQVTITDIIVANGVMHVINNVLNPSNSTAKANTAATTQAVAFAGASSASTVPFTSGISATTTAPSASTMTAGAEKAYGTMGVAAMIGMGVIAGAF
ncbi:related to TGF beta induced protein ig-h3 precursor [Phialocephala subalpina]|uniref:Related to TGF beta induced protein ig-h3 n=1 Tax=Phialocephala subalpina TaxID=576137 RepID=A0A1L7WIP1_9HELO|nr:related to TGF beta induced protein ig-h3 precursor [Phialocephala subalpina]